MNDSNALKYCLYARKSSEQDERQAMSIDSQIKEMQAMADREALNVIEIKKESFSAKQSGHRPVFNELLHDLRNGKYEAILTWAPDRLSRNAGDLGSLVDLMDLNRLQRIRTFGQSFRNTPNEKFLLMILCSQAKLENDNRGINVKRGIRAKCEMGWRPGSAPIGYVNRAFGGVRDIVLDTDRSEIIREIFERSGLMHQSGREIKDWLDRMNFTAKSGASLSLSQIYRILTNSFYYGSFEYPAGGQLYEGLHTPIITKELFDIVRARMTALVPEKPAWGSKRFPFKHLFYCGACGSRLTVEEHQRKLKDGGVNRHVYYHCTQSAKDYDCPERSITAHLISQQVLAMIEDGLFDDIEPTEILLRRIEKHKRITSQLIKDHGLSQSERAYFRNYASYVLKQGTLSEKDGLIRGLNIPLFVRDKKIYIRLEA